MRMKYSHFTLFCLFLYWIPLLSFPASTTASRFKFTLQPGPYAVGFKTVNQYDYSRSFYAGYDEDGNPVTENARPIQTSIWYPADPEKTKNLPRMKFKEYLDVIPCELCFPPLTPELKKESIDWLFYSWNIHESRRSELETDTPAVRDAEPAPGLFPLVIYAPSLNSMSIENQAICEYLASYGYIIVSSPSLGTHRRLLSIDIANVETQARDMEFLFAFMQGFPHVDKEKTAVMGFSFGGMSNVLMAMRNSRVDVLIALDSSLRNPKHFLTQSPDYNPDRLTIPTLFCISKEIPDELYIKIGRQPPQDRRFLFFENLKYSPATLIQFHDLIHYDFSSAFIRLLNADPTIASSLDKVNQGHQIMCQYVHMFLDAHLKGDTSALEFLTHTPKENGFDEKTLTLKQKKAQAHPLSEEEFLHQLNLKGASSINALQAEQTKIDPQYKINPDVLGYYAARLIIKNNLPSAQAIFQFMLKNDPNNFDALSGLGDVSRLSNQTAEALKYYEKALQLRPIDTNLQNRIQELKKQLNKR